MKKNSFYFDASSCTQNQEILVNLIQTLTSSGYGPQSKPCGVQGRSPGGGCGGRSSPLKKIGFFFKLKIKIEIIWNFSKFQKCSNLHRRCRMCWNDWKISFSIFSYWDMIIFVPIFLWFLSSKSTITQKLKSQKSENLFLFVSAHCASFMYIWPLLKNILCGDEFFFF